jgi:hypothetical protein
MPIFALAQIILLIAFVALVRNRCLKRRRFLPVVAAVFLGLEIEAVAFALVNYGLSLTANMQEARNWGESFAMLGAAVAVILFMPFVVLYAAAAKSFDHARVLLSAGGFLTATVLFDWLANRSWI